MGCQSVRCKSCNQPRPACQLVNGVCSVCRDLANKNKK